MGKSSSKRAVAPSTRPTTAERVSRFIESTFGASIGNTIRAAYKAAVILLVGLALEYVVEVACHGSWRVGEGNYYEIILSVMDGIAFLVNLVKDNLDEVADSVVAIVRKLASSYKEIRSIIKETREGK